MDFVNRLAVLKLLTVFHMVNVQSWVLRTTVIGKESAFPREFGYMEPTYKVGITHYFALLL